MKKAMFLVFLILGLGCFLFPSSSHGAASIKIGIVDTYSGPPANMSQDVLDGFKMVVKEINAKGGIKGRKIEFVVRLLTTHQIKSILSLQKSG